MCGNNNQNMLQLAEHYDYAFPKICLFRFHSLPNTTPACLSYNNLPNEQRLYGTSVGKSKASGYWQIIRKPKWDSMSGCRDFSSRPRWGDENHQQHQKGSPYSSLAGCNALKEGEIINFEVLTGEYELLLVFEITGGCGRQQEELECDKSWVDCPSSHGNLFV